MAKPVILIDGSGWLFRAYHALPPLANAKGEPTGAVYGMGNMLRKLMKDYAPEHIAVVFDPKGKTFRDELFAEYKATRSATPEDLTAQFPVIVDMLGALGLPVLTVDGFEADDVIGTLATQAQDQGREVLIVTSDKDMAQLVTDNVGLLDTMKQPPGIRKRDGVIERFGVPPERMIDYLALVGDTSDNIPGVPLVGPKTAAKWLGEFGTLDGIVENADKISGKAGENLRLHLHQLPLARELATIRCDVPLDLGPQDLAPRAPDNARLLELYRRCGFFRWVEELEKAASASAGPVAASAPPPKIVESAPVATPPPPAKKQLATRADTVLDEAALHAMVARLEKAPLVCVDTETDNIDSNRARLVGLSFAVEEGHGWYVPVAHDFLGAPPQLPMATVLAAVKPVLADASKPKVGQHLKYDLNVLNRHGVEVNGIAHDTMLQSYVLDATGNRHDMDSLALKYLDHTTIHFEDIAGKGKNQITFNQVSIDKAAEYSAEDADVTLRLHHVLYPQVAAVESLKRVYETIEMPLLPVLASMEQAGVAIDGALLKRISVELVQRMDEMVAEAYREAGGEFNIGSPKQLQQILYERLQLPVLGKTPKGDASTAEDVLEELAAQHRLPRLILDWRALSKLRSTYTDQLPQAINPQTGRVHTSYGQAVAATGRLSSSDPNLQNIPVRNAEGRRIRQAFVAPPDQLLLSIDYSQIELRLMAHFSGDAKLQDAFRQGLDIHQATAAEVLGLPLESVSADQRRAAKATNFGLIYGISAFGLAKQLGSGRAEAQEYIDRFFGRYPGVKQFMDRTRHQAHEQGYVETQFGRRLYLPNIRSKNQAQRQYAERTAINAPLQGTAADLIKLAMIDVHRFLRAEHPAVRMIMQVHDELVFEGPQDLIAELAPKIARRMCEVTKLDVPLVADWGVGSNWDSAHSPQGHESA
jgi:DNA polymerase-1